LALSRKTNLRANVELCRPRNWSVEPRNYGRLRRLTSLLKSSCQTWSMTPLPVSTSL